MGEGLGASGGKGWRGESGGDGGGGSMQSYGPSDVSDFGVIETPGWAASAKSKQAEGSRR